MQPEQVAWLAEFVRIVSRNNFGSWPPKAWIDEGMMYLSGSIGYDVILRTNGEVWMYEYDLLVDNDPGTWRQLVGNERILVFVIASERYPELTRLLPEKPEANHPCELCKGTGRIFNITGCVNCGGLGWIPDEIV